MGSITKTFTGDPGDAVPRRRPARPRRPARQAPAGHPRTADLTVRRMLAHLSGLQREPVGDVWESLEGPSIDDLLAGLDEAEAVLPPGAAAPLQQPRLRAARRGRGAAARQRRGPRCCRTRVLDPLEMRRTSTVRRSPPFAARVLRRPLRRARCVEEPEFPGNAFAPAAELWSTTARPRPVGAPSSPSPPAEVLSSDTVEEMCHPQVDVRPRRLEARAGASGSMLHRRGERVVVGHDGAMPGFLAGLAVRRPEKVGRRRAGQHLVRRRSGWPGRRPGAVSRR